MQERRKATRCGAIIVVPILYRNTLLGTITAINRLEQRDFTQVDVDLLETIASQVGVLIKHNKLYHDLLSEIDLRQKAQVDLEKAYSDQEQRVDERTLQLAKKNREFEREFAERIKAERFLRDTQQNFYVAFHSSPAAQVISSVISSQILDVNEAYCQLLEYSREELLSHSAIELGIWVNLQDRLTVMEILNREGRVRNFETMFRTKSGSIKTLITSFEPIDLLGEKCVIATGFDVTERNQALRASRESEEKYRLLFNEAPTGIVLVNSHGTIIDVNPATLRILGSPSVEATKQINVLTFPPLVKSGISEDFQYVFDSLQSLSSERSYTSKWGKNVFLRNMFAPLPDETGQYKLVLAIIEDITDRKQAEDAMLVSEARYRALFEDSPIAIWEEDFSEVKKYLDELRVQGVSDLDSYFRLRPEALTKCADLIRIIDANRSAVKLFQAQDKKELIDSVNQTTSSEELKQLLLVFRAIFEGDLRGDWVGVDETLTGVPIDINLVWSVAPGHERDYSKVIVITEDVSERKRAERGLEKQNYRLNSLREIDSAILKADSVEMIIEISLKQICELIECQHACLILMSSEDVNAERFHITTQREIETSYLHGESLYVLKDTFEILSKKKQLLISNINEAPAFLPRQWLDGSEGVRSIFCLPIFSKNKIIGIFSMSSVSLFFFDEEQTNLCREVTNQISIAMTQNNLIYELRELNVKLEERVAERTAALNEINVELQHANKAKDEFLATMSHELRTPLNSIIGLSESLLEERRGPLNESQKKSIQIIETSGTHLLDLINDILDISKIDAGKFDVYPQVIELNALCLSSLALVKQQAYTKSIDLIYKKEEFFTKVYADPRRLKQILINLLANAIKFTPRGGSVELKIIADVENDSIQFIVLDTGIGITQNNLKRLFKPFVQVDSSLNRQFEGSGLGLVLVQKLTDLHGGSVRVESEVGKGSRFVVTLPWGLQIIAEEERSYANKAGFKKGQADKDKDIRSPSERKLILLAEDNLANILVLSEYFEGRGYKLEVAHNGLEVIEKAEQTQPDLILMDIQMPTVDGLEATRRLRSMPRFVSTPIIALTALVMPGDRERCIAAGATDYISKPVKLKQLAELIRNLLGEKPD